jgi:hypothetical protein
MQGIGGMWKPREKTTWMKERIDHEEGDVFTI